MSRRGNCHDNAVAESFFSALREERIKRRIYPTRAAATSDVFDYIEMFYNPARRHGSAGNLSPVELESCYAFAGQRVSKEVWSHRGLSSNVRHMNPGVA